ncbi:Altered inheritance of mitochondria protein 9, mitochondrial [Mycena indigotica]|uniref:Altered inheritance of mitochondria protein 9, mitochondrial n=1 Tax=Mycena indigotica TaxID=2126181 RepID=A0A8H6W9B9_9AGAR|nr:Altered inheritance of mitochondria protein 9, mitochondrial [Mycena indigotica]KAF7303969.1 Altered inheritance of mitochondria protein 9, mitochondrial [Mycena indigotica]
MVEIQVTKPPSKLPAPLPPLEDEAASRAFLVAWDPILDYASATLASQMNIPTLASEVREQLRSFDLEQLKVQAFHIKGVSVTGVHLLAVGGGNFVFLVALTDKTDFIARLRIPTAGLSAESVSAELLSEVATMQFVAKHTTIPVPAILGWNDTSQPVGTPYIFMERALGVPLAQVSPLFTTESWRRLTAEVADFEQQLVDHPLEAIGVLTDADGTVGPPLHHYMLLPPNSPRFTSSRDYLMARLRGAQERIPDPVEWQKTRALYSEDSGGNDANFLTRDEFYNYLERLHAHATTMKSIPELFRLAHNDWHSLNVLVRSAEDPTIVAVIDWQGSHVRPFWDHLYQCFMSPLFQRDNYDVAIPEEELSKLWISLRNNMPFPESWFWVDALRLINSDPFELTKTAVEKVLAKYESENQ